MEQLTQGGSYVIGADGTVKRAGGTAEQAPAEVAQQTAQQEAAPAAEQAAPVQPVQQKPKGGA